MQWVKTVDLAKTPRLGEYAQAHHFIKVADIELDDDVKPNGTKSRQTLIKAAPTISSTEFCAKAIEWLYLLVMDGHVVKIGGTRDGLGSRWASYLCGHHTAERGKSGKCSVTNAHIYNTLEHHLRQGRRVEMYGYKLPVTCVTQNILGEAVTFSVQTYHKYESKFIQAFKEAHGANPVLSDNADPEYKT